MRLRFTEAAGRDLDMIVAYITANYPGSAAAFEQRLRQSLARIERWPGGAQAVASYPGVRMVPLIRYPYKIFYRIGPDAIEILHIYHATRQEPLSFGLAGGIGTS